VVNQALTGLNLLRDSLALKIKAELEAAAFGNTPVAGAQLQTTLCQAAIGAAGAHAQHL